MASDKPRYDGHNRKPQGLPWKTLLARRLRRSERRHLRSMRWEPKS